MNTAGKADESLTLELEAMTRGIASKSGMDRPEVFSSAIRFISSMETSPSCHKLATVTLLRSCQSIHPNSNQKGKAGVAERLDRVKSIFAARLAVCELIDANAAIPHQCNSLQVQVHLEKRSMLKRFTTSSSSNRENTVSNESGDEPSLEISNCLGALESRPQWWTSYSNARQNAIAICEATRSEVEKGKVDSNHETHFLSANFLHS